MFQSSKKPEPLKKNMTFQSDSEKYDFNMLKAFMYIHKSKLILARCLDLAQDISLDKVQFNLK